jgi:hypothetical protein
MLYGVVTDSVIKYLPVPEPNCLLSPTIYFHYVIKIDIINFSKNNNQLNYIKMVMT